MHDVLGFATNVFVIVANHVNELVSQQAMLWNVPFVELGVVDDRE